MSHMPIEDDPRLTAFALGEIDDDDERAEIAARLEDDPEARAFVDDVRRLAQVLTEELRRETAPGLADDHRATIEKALIMPNTKKPGPFLVPRPRHLAMAAAVLIAGGGLIAMSLPSLRQPPNDGFALVHTDHEAMPEMTAPTPAPIVSGPASRGAAPGDEGGAAMYHSLSTRESLTTVPADAYGDYKKDVADGARPFVNLTPRAEAPAVGDLVARLEVHPRAPEPPADMAASRAAPAFGGPAKAESRRLGTPSGPVGQAAPGNPGGNVPPPASNAPPGTPALALGRQPAGGGMGMGGIGGAGGRGAVTRGMTPPPSPASIAGKPSSAEGAQLAQDQGGYLARFKARKELADVPARAADPLQVAGAPAEAKLGELRDEAEQVEQLAELQKEQLVRRQQEAEFNREAFAPIVENPFVKVVEAPLSTFGIDVDTASYANVRRFLLGENRLPPPDAVRIEELVNYFTYDYTPPQDDRPFAVNVEFARCPWRAEHRLLRVGLKGKVVSLADRPASNLVFLIDVSGSMNDSNKLPWVKAALAMLVDKLTENDRVTIVVYAAAKGVALPPTQGDRKDLILGALDRLHAGGSTNGGEGLKLAYDIAQQQFINGGTNRIILCTDGDFNTGDITDLAGVTRLVEERRATKVKITVLGFGQGNLQDDKLEALANKGDGQYAYIDTLKEAHRVLIEQMSGTLLTIAKDVKLQLDFNPRFVGAYRLLGYENRMLRAQDFRDDTKDAGDIGAGHTVTALYELMPPGQEGNVPAADDSKFVEKSKLKEDDAARSQTLVVKLRYKQPDGDVSTGFEVPARDEGQDYATASPDFKFAAAVAEFGLLLRGSKFQGTATYDAVLELAQASRGDDPKGERQEFLDLVRRARDLSKK